jgi:hypothetical protein
MRIHKRLIDLHSPSDVRAMVRGSISAAGCGGWTWTITFFFDKQNSYHNFLMVEPLLSLK